MRFVLVAARRVRHIQDMTIIHRGNPNPSSITMLTTARRHAVRNAMGLLIAKCAETGQGFNPAAAKIIAHGWKIVKDGADPELPFSESDLPTTPAPTFFQRVRERLTR